MSLLRPLQPALAAVLAACVLLLGWAAQAPDLHETLCRHIQENQAHVDHADASHSDHLADAACPKTSRAVASSAPDDASASAPDDANCAVTLFAAGCETPPAPLWLAEPALNVVRVSHFTELMLARTLRGPARVCGPPSLA
jgi:hypothetical protein